MIVTWRTLAERAEAERVAKLLSLPCQASGAGCVLSEYWLEVTAERLQLVHSQDSMTAKLFADFLRGPLGYRLFHGGGRNQAIARAVGLKKYKGKLAVLDATAGLGRDAFILATLGCDVQMIERSPIIAALLLDGLKRAEQSVTMAHVARALRVTVADAGHVLQNLQNEDAPDVVYLDPMFPCEKKSALSKIEMRIIRDIVGDDLDADQLLWLALQKAKKRVVVKRSSGAPVLANTAPSFLVEGKSSRYDVYTL